jgi:hypothetical protein
MKRALTEGFGLVSTRHHFYGTTNSENCLLTYSCYSGIYPGQGYEFLLFHQPNAKRLEVIKLTGDRYVPRGAHPVIAEDLGDVKRICTGKEWLGAPAVAAKVQVAGDGFANSTFATAY